MIYQSNYYMDREKLERLNSENKRNRQIITDSLNNLFRLNVDFIIHYEESIRNKRENILIYQLIFSPTKANDSIINQNYMNIKKIFLEYKNIKSLRIIGIPKDTVLYDHDK